MKRTNLSSRPFKEASYKEQISRLRSFGLEVLKQFPVQVGSVRLLNHGENTTFKVRDVRGKCYVLRIHRQGYHTKAAILEELKWTQSLKNIPGIHVPVPRLSRKSSLVVSASSPLLDGERHCDLFVWIPGRFKNKNINERDLFLLGKTIAKIHLQKFKPKHRLYWDSEGLLGKTPKFGPILMPKFATAQQRTVVRRGHVKILNKIRAYEEKFPERMGMIHADLHFGNLLWGNSSLGVIDFDDSGYGFRIYDLAVTSWAIRWRKSFSDEKKATLIRRLKEGYSSLIPMDKYDDDFLELLIIARELVMFGWLQSRMDNPKIRPYMKISLKRNVESLLQL